MYCLFCKNTDTEVILQSYLHWGEDCVNHFNGMWAFALWDKEKQARTARFKNTRKAEPVEPEDLVSDGD